MARFEVNRHCPLCGGAAVSVLGRVAAAAVGRSNETYRANYLEILRLEPGDEFPLVECGCGFIFSGWLPDKAFLHRLYEETIDHARTSSETIWYRQALLEFAASFLQFVQEKNARPQLRLLDFGCGYGALLRMLSCRDIDGYGYDPSRTRVEKSNGTELHILADLDEMGSAGPFDLFICTEVLEHLPDPRSALKFLRQNARPGALLAITVPNFHKRDICASLDEPRGVLPRAINPWEHLNYFSDGTLRLLLTQEGFTVEHDFGRTQTALNACARFGDIPSSIAVVNSLRIAKRAWVARPSTQLFCRCN